MKLTVTKKNIKNLSQDNKRLPSEMTKFINGGTMPQLRADSSDTSVTGPSSPSNQD
ncbi:hypothetical protein [Pseudoalteromonas luteoviolacea]|uniref:Uncharacterized protein n=1 Tax=Pseudoalteromonas luteoviolacea DSM 6061 TaxID=1365250 RepID=A0A166XHR6_9GAMM|nr:hypothetical protein [Pseudoalteromonas luteoviolacea]KZN40337.1 hypothetical protein N475_12790 [Pseudoalteromonas luteoviolacea DSM 6061]KZN57301.1 hypothetical protein N474_08860 [Pseudoalteromonas luteoviolacea CPMOR-2]MBE0387881.1 hypothetical protein [Pseudoalteromonas luteoviolacea DSM 6061]